MVSAADLQKQHQAGQPSAAPITDQPPMADPFPSLMQDPFPPAASTSAINYNGKATNGEGEAKKTAQPDFSSESAFPSLGAAPTQAKGQWGSKLGSAPASTWNGSAPVIQRSINQHSFSLVLSHESINKLGSVMAKIQNKYKGVKIEASTTRKTATTTFVLKASDENSIKQAKKELTVLLAKQVSVQVMIPASLRAFVIGTKGKNLKAITEQTGVKVNVPPRDPAAEQTDGPVGRDVDYDNDEQIPVTVEGDEINVKQAQAMIQAIVAERTSRTTQRLTHVDHVFYPFVSGAKGANVAKLEAEVGEGDVSVRIPPRAAFLPAKEGDEEDAEPKRERDLAIIVSGDREKVAKVVAAIDAQVEEMKRSFRTLAISIPKRQHRFLVGDAANEILASTSCSVELASIDDPSDSVTIRGPQSQLPLALTAAMEKANAVRVEVVDLVALHRGAASASSDPLTHAKNLLRWLNVGGKIPRPQGVQIFLPRPAIVESSGTVQIEIVGADANEVAKARSTIQELAKSVPPSFVEEIDVDPLVYRLIIGKKGQGLKQYEARGVDVIFPPQSAALVDGESRSDVLLVLSGASVVAGLPTDKKARDAKAKEILTAVKDDLIKAQVAAADIRTETISVAAKLHRAILGPNGTTLNAVIGEDRAVAVKLGPGQSAGADKSSTPLTEDQIMIRGPSAEVERVVKELKRIAEDAEQDSIINGHVAELTIDSAHVPHLVGRGGAAVTKLREELGIRVDFGEPSAATTDADGKKRTKKGSTTKVTLTGRKENVEEAKRRLLAQADKLADETSIVLKVPAELHGNIIGQGGKYVTRLQDTYGVRINFPSAQSASSSNGTSTPVEGESKASPSARANQKPDEVVIKGGKKGVEGARQEMLELLEYEKELNNVTTLSVSSKSIARIMGKGGATINQIRDETEAQVDVDREEDEGKGTTNIRLRGTKKAIAAAKEAILAISKEVDAEETYTLKIAAEHHGLLIGPQGQNIRDLIIKAGGPEDAKVSSQFVLFPKRGDKAGDEVTVRGPGALARKIRDELQAAAKVLDERVVYGVIVAPQAQRMLIGRGGSRQSELQSQYGVRLVFPGWKEYATTGAPINASELSNGTDENVVKISGSQESCKALAAEIASSFASASRVVAVPRSVHAKLATPQFFRQLRSDFGVSVDTPRERQAAAASASASASTARIDDDEEDVEFTLEKLDVNSDESVQWTLTGKDDAALANAEKRIASAVQRAGEFSHQGRLRIEQSAVPRVIGRGGSGLMAIQADSGASVEIPRDQGGLCIIRGSESAVLAAKDAILRAASARRD